MDYDQILEMVKRVREELKGKQHKLDKNKNGKIDAQDFEHLRKMKEELDLDEEQLDELSPELLSRYRKAKGSQRIHRLHPLLHDTPEKKAEVQAHNDNITKKVGQALGKEMAAHRKRLGVDINYRKIKNEEAEIEETMSHAAKTTMKHIKNPTAGEKKAAKDIKPGIAGYRDRIAMLQSAKNRGALKNEEVEEVEEGWDDMLKTAKARADAPAQKTTTKTFHDVKKTSTGTVYTKQSDAEGMSKGTGEDAAKAAEPKEKRGRGRPVGSKSGARQAGSSSKTDYRGFVDHTLNLPARK